ncbi:hypothetical protein EMIT047CA2_90202 [Pseudomonas soli]
MGDVAPRRRGQRVDPVLAERSQAKSWRSPAFPRIRCKWLTLAQLACSGLLKGLCPFAKPSQPSNPPQGPPYLRDWYSYWWLAWLIHQSQSNELRQASFVGKRC